MLYDNYFSIVLLMIIYFKQQILVQLYLLHIFQNVFTPYMMPHYLFVENMQIQSINKGINSLV